MKQTIHKHEMLFNFEMKQNQSKINLFTIFKYLFSYSVKLNSTNFNSFSFYDLNCSGIPSS